MDYALLNTHRKTVKSAYLSAKEAIADGKFAKARRYIEMAMESCTYIVHNSVDADERARYREYADKLKALDEAAANPRSASADQSDEHVCKVPVVKPKRMTLDQALAALDALIGLESVKAEIHPLVDQNLVFKMRTQRGLKVPDMSNHMVFTGNPGTGKTTVARLLAGIFLSLGMVSKGHLVETKRDDLVAEYVGQTAVKTQQVIDRAIGGVLFIDEAYALAKGGNDFGQEAIDTLLVAMENYRNDLIVIVAGYDDLMAKFLRSNPGLPSRFTRTIHFDDYNEAELLAIYEKFCRDNQYQVSEAARKMLVEHFADVYAHRGEHFGNGREVRKYFEDTIKKQSSRINAAKRQLTNEEIMAILPEDLPN